MFGLDYDRTSLQNINFRYILYAFFHNIFSKSILKKQFSEQKSATNQFFSCRRKTKIESTFKIRTVELPFQKQITFTRLAPFKVVTPKTTHLSKVSDCNQ